jgi:tRNA-splicing ligase RtcB
MSEITYNVIAPENGVPVKAWTKGVPLEDAARKQLLAAAGEGAILAGQRGPHRHC